MKKPSIVIWVYALLLLIGGLMGFIKANSLVSLLSSSIIALLFFVCGYFIRKGHATAYYFAAILTIFLLAFFGYRFALTHQFMPAGLMTLLSALMISYLTLQRKYITNHLPD